MNLPFFKKNNQANSEEFVNNKKQEKKGSFWNDLLVLALLAIFIVLPIRVSVFQPFFVSGQSMEPNFHDGEYLIVDEFGYKGQVRFRSKHLFNLKQFKSVERGDAVVFRYPRNPRNYFIKRVVGLPGEKVIIYDSQIKIFNDEYPKGFLLEEGAYLPEETFTRGEETFELGDDEYVVLGDNRGNSSDSRSWGKLQKKYMIGKVFLRGWPLSQVKIFK